MFSLLFFWALAGGARPFFIFDFFLFGTGGLLIWGATPQALPIRLLLPKVCFFFFFLFHANNLKMKGGFFSAGLKVGGGEPSIFDI